MNFTIKKYPGLIFASLLLTLQLAIGQNNFYQVRNVPDIHKIRIAVNESNKVISIAESKPLNSFGGSDFLYLSEVPSNSFDSLLTIRMQLKDGVRGFYNRFTNPDPLLPKYIDKKVYWTEPIGFSFSVSMGIFCFDLENQDHWAKKLSGGKIDFTFDPYLDRIAIFQGGQTIRLLNASDGEEIRRINYYNSLFRGAWRYDIKFFEKTKSYFALSSIKDNVNDSIRSAIYKLDNNGLPLKWISHGPAIGYEHLLIHQDELFLLGRIKNSFSFLNNEYNLILSKLDTNLNTLWSKIYAAESFEYLTSTLNFSPDGDLLLGYSTSGYFPVIFARLDTAGHIAEQKGYPLHTPTLSSLTDGSLLMNSFIFDSAGYYTIISKTDTEGNITGCETYPTCLIELPNTIQEESFDLFYEIVPPDTLADLNLKVDSIFLHFENYCDFPAPPTPNFSAPDTICITDTLLTSDVENTHAHGIKWQLTGPGTDTVIENSDVFLHYFKKPGNYSLLQKIWFLGCSFSHSDTIIVLPELEVTITPLLPLCDPPGQIVATANRPIHQIQWIATDSDSIVTITENGTYEVQVSDGYCIAMDSFDAHFVSAQLDGNPAIILPPDTIICEQDLPFSIRPNSPLSQVFGLDLTQLDTGDLTIPYAGAFTIFTRIQDCIFQNDYVLQTVDCNPKIYLPEAFSPNNDGINDEFFPQGKNFTPLEMKIFDRWGGLVYQSNSFNPSWDGGNESAGVYVYIFKYINNYSGKTELSKGSVTILK